MRNRSFWVAAVGLVAVLVTGGLFASNMGFKLNYPLEGPQPGPQNGTNTIALPYNQQTTLVDAADLITDIEATGGPGTVLQVAHYVKSADGLETYTGAAGTPFALIPGDGYRVQVTTDIDYVIVGSHDPGLPILLEGPAPGPQNGTNAWSYPYHSTSANAEDLISEVNAAAGSGVVLQVARYVRGADGLETYTGAAGTPFPLTPGESYRIQVTQNVSWTPSHY